MAITHTPDPIVDPERFSLEVETFRAKVVNQSAQHGALGGHPFGEAFRLITPL